MIPSESRRSECYGRSRNEIQMRLQRAIFCIGSLNDVKLAACGDGTILCAVIAAAIRAEALNKATSFYFYFSLFYLILGLTALTYSINER